MLQNRIIKKISLKFCGQLTFLLQLKLFLTKLLDVAYEKLLQRCEDYKITLGILFFNKIKSEYGDSVLGIVKNLDGDTGLFKQFAVTDTTNLSEIAIEAVTLVKSMYQLDVFVVISNESSSIIEDIQNGLSSICNITVAHDIL